MLPTPPRGDETSADVYRLLSTIHDQLASFERNAIRGLESRLKAIQSEIQRIEAQLHRIEGRLGR